MNRSRPLLSSTTHLLPFDKLSPGDFERLCLWLVRREGFDQVQHLGASGGEQGRDIVAMRDGEQWAFQCKRVHYFGPADAIREVTKVLGLAEAQRPARLVFLTSCDVSANAREQAQEQAVGIACEFWAETELDERVKRHPELLEEFFHWPGHLDEAQHQAYTKRYLAQLEQECAVLYTEGVDRAPVPLAEVFVMLDAVKTSAREIKTDVLYGDEAELAGSEREQEKGLARRAGVLGRDEPEARSAPAEPPVALSEAVHAHPHLVIMGEPGSGKSTTLQYLALSFLDRQAAGAGPGLDDSHMPIRVDLRSYDPQKPIGDALVEAIVALGQFYPASAETSRMIAEDLLHGWLSNERPVLLLDGLDEVHESRRGAAAEGILRFARTEEGARCRIVVTTRIAGYRAVRELGEPFFHYCIRPFQGPKDALSYAAHWLRHLGEIETEAEARERAEALLERISRHAGLIKMMGNPLLLRLIVALEAEGKEIAKTRAELYRRYVDEVLEAREEAKIRSGAAPAEKPWSEKTLHRALEVVAWALQNDEHRTAAQLAQAINEQVGEVKDGRGIIDYLRERMGLLVVRGYDRGELVAFRHPTFREFFVARILEKRWSQDRKATWRLLRARLHHPDWREPILLLAGLIEDRADCAELVRRIRRARSLFEGELHRDLILAASVVAESRLEESREVRIVLDRLLRLFQDLEARRQKTVYAWGYVLVMILHVAFWLGMTALLVMVVFAARERGAANLPASFWDGLPGLIALWLYLGGMPLLALVFGVARRARRVPIGNSRHQVIQSQIDDLLILLGRQHSELVLPELTAALYGNTPQLWPRASRILKSLEATTASGIAHFKHVIGECLEAEALEEGSLVSEEELGRQYPALTSNAVGRIILALLALVGWLARSMLVSIQRKRHPFHMFRLLDGTAQRLAIESMGEMGSGCYEVAEFLLPLLEQEDAPRSFAGLVQGLRVLGKFEIVNERVMNVLTTHLGGGFGTEAAIESLIQLHTVAPEPVESALTCALSDENSYRVTNAARTLLLLPPSPSTEGIWRELLDHADSEIGTRAMVRLYQAGQLTAENLAAHFHTMETLNHTRFGNRFDSEQLEIAEALQHDPAFDPTMLGVLAQVLSDVSWNRWDRVLLGWNQLWFQERRTARRTAERLVKLAQRHRKAVEDALQQVLRGEDLYAQEMAVWALGEIGNATPETLDLIEQVRQRCIPYPIEATPFWRDSWSHRSELEEQSMLTWLTATAALGSLGQPSAESVTALRYQLAFPIPALMRSAVRGLGKAGVRTRRVELTLKKQVESWDAEIAEMALTALQELDYDVVPLASRVMARARDEKANAGARVLARIAADRTQAEVAMLPEEPMIEHASQVENGSNRSHVSRRLVALGIGISALLGLTSNLLTSALYEQRWFSTGSLPIRITLIVFILSFCGAVVLAWRTGQNA